MPPRTTLVPSFQETTHSPHSPPSSKPPLADRRQGIFIARYLLCIFLLSLVSFHPTTQRHFSLHALRASSTHPLVIVAMYHNEAPYLLEWLAYHRTHGVTHFYLYDHLSTDDHAAVLAPLVRQNLVTLTPAAHALRPASPAHVRTLLRRKLVVQLACLAHWYAHHRTRADWVLALDIDEFVHLPRDQMLASLLHTHVPRGVGGVHLTRVPFSTDGHARRLRRSQLATAEFGERMKRRMLGREAGKIAYRVGMQRRMFWHLHEFQGAEGGVADVAGRVNWTGEGASLERREEDGYIVHYVARSLESCEEKRRLSGRWGGGWRHRTKENWCARRHRGGEGYFGKWFERAEEVVEGMRRKRKEICKGMWELNREYCKRWRCCGEYAGWREGRGEMETSAAQVVE